MGKVKSRFVGDSEGQSVPIQFAGRIERAQAWSNSESGATVSISRAVGTHFDRRNAVRQGGTKRSRSLIAESRPDMGIYSTFLFSPTALLLRRFVSGLKRVPNVGYLSTASNCYA